MDVILTNPPFGGEEERGVQDNFPNDLQTAETALLFLQLIMRKLHRHQTAVGRPSRAAVVVPESVMSDAGVARRIRQRLISEFRLHTVVRLPKGVFEPYSDIQTNLLFLDTSGSTDVVWIYQHDVMETRRAMRDPRYTVSSPLTYDELRPVLTWFGNKSPNERAWIIDRSQIENANYSLDFRNPTRRLSANLSFNVLSDSAEQHLTRALSCAKDAASLSIALASMQPKHWPRVKLAGVLTKTRVEANVNGDTSYRQITVKLYGKGVVERTVILGKDIKTRPQFLAHADDLIMSRIDARNGAFGVIPYELTGALVTQDFPMFRIDQTVILSAYLAMLLKSDEFVEICKRSSRGTTNRKRLKEELFLGEELAIPPMEVQHRILKIAAAAATAVTAASEACRSLEGLEREMCNYFALAK